MKKIIIPIGALLMTGMAHAQLSPTENYVYSKTYLDYNTSNIATKTSETVQYFDGLGRPKQIVNIKASPTGKDVVTPIVYDGFGRQTRDYLPVPQSATTNGAIYGQNSGLVPLPVSDPTGVYPVGEKIFTEKKFEDSPLDRVLEQRQVGLAWGDKPVKFEYGTNVASEVKKYVTVTTPANGTTSSAIGSATATYGANQLYKTTVTDEDGNKTIEFKNGKGQVLLVRKVINASENADTYYVYNEYNQLAFVIPPKASVVANVNTVLGSLCYIYRYDGRNRLALKKLPGKAWEYMVYDKQDRVIMTQDAVMGANKQWLFTKYDQFGRPAYTGIYTSTQAYGLVGREVEQTKADAAGSNNVARTASVGFNVGGRGVYYDNTASTSYPNSITSLLSINYYDTYPVYGFNPTFPTNILGMPVMTDNSTGNSVSTKSLPVMSMVRNIEDTNWTSNYTYYDNRGRAIGTHSVNYLGGFNRTETELDFAGIPKRMNTTHLRKPGEIGVSIQERFVYDAQNRLKQHYHQVNDRAEELLTDNSYNELSQLNNKKVGNNLQSIDYNYNIRGWLTDINKNQMTVANLDGKLFAYKIKYNQKEGVTNPDSVLFPGKNVEAKYNGNIAEVDWRAVETIGANPSLTPKRYGYVYDKLNRLTAGYYQNPSNPNSKENIESIDYDLNGNISKLYRTSVMQNTIATVIDNLEYKYAGSDNKLTSIKDYANNSTGYEGGENTIGYDLNGNMTDMLDKGITTIKYNYLNLSNKLDYSKNGNESVTVNTKYRADGSKLQKETITTTTGIIGSSTSKKITDYLDGFQYLRVETPNPGGSEEFAANLETSRALETEAYSLMIPVDEPTLEATNPELQFFPTAEGFYDYAKSQYIYQYKDHLGNVRISFAKSSAGVLEITDSNDYYPFGMNHLKTGNSFFGPSAYKNYKYNGKELQETGMYDYGARMYMADIGRWGAIDPFAERYIKASPYHYALNNPVFFKDPDGKKIIIYYQTGSGSNQEWEYSYSKNRTTTGFDFLDKAVAALDQLYESNALNLDTDGNGEKDTNYLQKIIDSDKTLGVTSGEKSDFAEGLSYDKKSKDWKSGDKSAIGRIRFNSNKGLLFNNSEYNDENQKGLIERYKSGKLNKDDKINSPTASLGHELVHAGNFLLDNANFFQRKKPFDKFDNNGFINNEEIKTTILSNQVNDALHEPQRKVYWGIKVPTTSVNSNKLQN
ncbi:RHS repeat-associated core domain-containing protein [Chryseobacterium paludis]|uniref:RHS repeat-associated core domain-containing protein n=1 Tax=Chryseobacterium paludis TaxID=2956784 RepID=UPI0021BFB27E|nr:RHS repeat-associated core domain-containing protein [Chryseobacterium paludis]